MIKQEQDLPQPAEVKAEHIKTEFVKQEAHGPPGNDELVKKFTQLWFACFFEKKLTRDSVLKADLPQIVADMNAYFNATGDPD